MDTTVFSALVPNASATTRDAIATTLSRFGDGVLAYAAERGVTIQILDRDEHYAYASAALTRLGIDVDAWPAPPAGQACRSTSASMSAQLATAGGR